MTTILVVEDEAPIRNEVMDWLSFEGYEVVGAEHGRIALELLAHTQPDLILSDVRMPEMDGYQLLGEIRSNPELTHIPVIFISAAAERDSVRKGMNIGADDYITKPFTHADVLHAVQARLHRKTVHDHQVQMRIEALSSALITEREQRLLKSRLIAMFSHDFRNPLTAILSSSTLIREYGDQLTPERRTKYVDRIDSNVHLLIQMLDEMMMVAEMEAGHLECILQPTNFPEFITDLLDEFRSIDSSKHAITLNNSIADHITADPKLLRHILMNLISNALKYSPNGTEVTISASATNQHLRFEVQDQGRGIPSSDIEQLFTPFFRATNSRDVKGTGLGLTIVKECVEHCNGTIDVASTVGRGTCVTVVMPRPR